MTFVKAIDAQAMKGKTVTENGMTTRVSSKSALVDFFFQVGALRGKDPVPAFAKAFEADSEIALRIAQWARDPRGGAGERQLFRDMLVWLEVAHPEVLVNTSLIAKIPEIGRWDDMLVLGKTNHVIKGLVMSHIQMALQAGNGLCAKWMPRKGSQAIDLRTFMGFTPKQYRKTLVNLTKVVESQMCANDWEAIEFPKVPSLAMSRYAKAFGKHAPMPFATFKSKVTSGEVEIKADVLYPHNVVRSLMHGDTEIANLQWKALPDYVGDANILVVADVSGSMAGHAIDKSGTTALDVCVSLAMYCAMKNTGAFANTFMTFSGNPQFQRIKNVDLSKAMEEVRTADWGMNTDLSKAMEKILATAIKGKISQEEMPRMLLIMSDMQFDECGSFTAHQMMKDKFQDAGYKMPEVVFWNLAAKAGVPVKFDKSGTALVSGFSPAILKSILSVSELDHLTPENVMLEAVMVERYSL